ncbi:MAG: molybdenum cofactor biosynthesis protein MoaE [Verrucomicrobiota bacterium]
MSSRPLFTDAAIELPTPSYDENHGAILQFLGVVRRLEEEKPLEGIRYTCYLPMAERVAQDMIERGEKEFGKHKLIFQHRLGFVPVAEPSVLVQVGTPHSRKAYELCQFYLKQVKTQLPIWKEPVFQ